MAERGRLKAPPGLAKSGRALWAAVCAGFELREDERQALVASCRTLDELARLEAELAGAPVMTAGSKGQERVNPLFTEVRSHRLALKAMLAAVGLTDADADRLAGAARSSAGRKLAAQRWSHGSAA